jgi:hypothetical protein
LVAVELVFGGELAGVLLLEVRADDVGRDEEPSQAHQDACLSGLVVSEEVYLAVKDDGEETDGKGGHDQVVPQAHRSVELGGLHEEAPEGDASEDVPAKLIVGGDGEMLNAMVWLVFVPLQHYLITPQIIITLAITDSNRIISRLQCDGIYIKEISSRNYIQIIVLISLRQ